MTQGWPPCDGCGAESWHRYTHKAAYRQQFFYCCRCHIANGGTPAKHHPDCQEALDAKRKDAA